MDLNKATTFVNSDQETDQILFNAIKQKFNSKTTKEAAAASPAKFNIPFLKIPICNTLENTQTVQSNKSPTELNKFLIKKLQEKHSNNLCERSREFVSPHLNSPDQSKIAVKYELTALESEAEHSQISSLSTAIGKLRVQENSSQVCVESLISSTSSPVTIDLRIALAKKFETQRGTPTRDLIKPRQNDDQLDFEIPFIDCDREDVSKKHKITFPASNDYCVKDVSQLCWQHSLAEPSAVGRLLSENSKKYLDPLPLKYLSSQFHQAQVKHNIEPFRFDTQSPDDVVLLSLSKYQRRHCN